MYEYAITFGLEVELFWKQKITSASALFFVNRYLVLGYNLSLLREFRSFTEFVSPSVQGAYGVLMEFLEV